MEQSVALDDADEARGDATSHVSMAFLTREVVRSLTADLCFPFHGTVRGGGCALGWWTIMRRLESVPAAVSPMAVQKVICAPCSAPAGLASEVAR